MRTSVFVSKLVEKRINTKLLIEFYEEVAATERLYNGLVEELVDPDELQEKQECVASIERFCEILRELREEYSGLRRDQVYATELARREIMIANAERFIELLENDVMVRIPDRLRD